MTALLTVRDLHVRFAVHGGTIEAVKGVSFRVPPGGTVALVGESGSGKSVIAQSIMGILPRAGRIAGGEILFADPEAGGAVRDLALVPPESREYRRIRGGRISMIFQEPMTSLSPLHTVGNQIGEALRLHRDVTRAEADDLTAEMLGLVGFPNPVKALRTYPFELSGGLRQRAMIAMALVCHPALLIADEPTTALDVTIQGQILKQIRDLQDALGMAVLVITHDLGVVANVAEEVVVLYRGEVMEAGTLRDIFHDARHPYLKALLHAVPRFHMEPGERLVPIREIESEGGRLLADKEAWPSGTDASLPLLEASGLTKRYTIRKQGWVRKRESSVIAVDDVGFTIRRGECLGLVGESGCGKTTISKMLMRAVKPDDGWILFNERGTMVDVLAMDKRALKSFRQRMQVIFQDPYSSLNPRMTVLDIITEPLLIHGIGDAEYRREMAKELMGLVGLDVRHLRRYPHSFSGGQRQRIGIARALALRPDLLICDEPVSALDVSIQAQVLNLLKDLRERLGLTYLFISHNLAVVDYVSDRIMVMCRGRIVEMAPREVLFRNPVHPYTKALLAAVPHPNPDEPLDLAALMDGRASDPAAWPHPFTIAPDSHPTMTGLGGGHYVRAHA
jgi:peptide/nickel transport system ATP-binding protein